MRGIAGAYVEDNKLYDQTTWMYKNIPACTANTGAGNTNCLTNVGTFPGTYVQNPGVQGNDRVDRVENAVQIVVFSVRHDLPRWGLPSCGESARPEALSAPATPADP